MRNHSCWFQSIEDPKYKYDIGEILYRCPNTGSLLEVEHNVEELKKDSPESVSYTHLTLPTIYSV